MKKDYNEGEYIIYQNGDSYELGRIKSVQEDGCFVFYHSGETASKTRWENIHKLLNSRHILKTDLGGIN